MPDANGFECYVLLTPDGGIETTDGELSEIERWKVENRGAIYVALAVMEDQERQIRWLKHILDNISAAASEGTGDWADGWLRDEQDWD